MKKRILAATLLLCPSVLLSSCDKVTEKQVEKDPIGVTAEAIALNFEETDTVKSAQDTLNADTARIRVDLTVEGVPLALNVYADEKNGSGALEMDKGVLPMALSLYFNDKELALESKELTDTPIGVKFDELTKEKILNSSFAEAIGLTDEDLDDEFFDGIEKLRETLSDTGAINKDTAEKGKEILEGIKKALVGNGCTVTTEKLELQDGVVPSVVTTFDITDETIDAAAEAILTALGDTEYPIGTLDTLSEEIDSLVQDYKDSVDSLVIKTGIAKKTGALVYAEVNFDAADGAMTVKLDLGSKPKESEKYILTIEADGQTGKIEYTRGAEDEKLTRSAKLTVGEEEYGTADLSWDKKTGDYVIRTTEGETETARLSGKLLIEKNLLQFSFDGTEDIPNIAFEIESGASVPTVPEYRDLLELSEQDINDAVIRFYTLAGGLSDYDDYEEEYEDGYGDIDSEDLDAIYGDYDYDESDWFYGDSDFEDFSDYDWSGIDFDSDFIG